MAKMESKLPGKIKGNMAGEGASSMAKSGNPGAGCVHMEAGANPNGAEMHDNGPKGDEAHIQIMSGPGSDKKMRTKTGRDQSPYDVK